jgi:hexosaminidase
MLENGFSCDYFNVADSPSFDLRGLTVDVSSRFVPMGTLEHILDGMLASKLNVLVFHFSGDQAVRVASPNFPELTAGLDGVYNSTDIAALLQYAHDRNIVVIPSVRDYNCSTSST